MFDSRPQTGLREARAVSTGGALTKVRHLRLFVVACAAAVALALPCSSQPLPVPELINYQGLIYLEDGSTDVTGTYDFEFRLYTASSGSADALWGESHEKRSGCTGKVQRSSRGRGRDRGRSARGRRYG